VNPRDDARRILLAAIAAADAREAVRRALRVEGDELVVMDEERIGMAGVERIILVGAGKAAAAMALGARDVLGGRIAGGTITTRDGYAAAVPGMEMWEAAHPVPDSRGLAGAADALAVARGAGARDLVLCLLSGGASALWPCPPDGVSLTDLNPDALRGAAAEAERLGWRAEIVADDLEGEVRGVAPEIARLALQRQRALAPGDPPLALLLGGETTVTVRGGGSGGRNQELALALAMELEGRGGIVAAALGTDGTDGTTAAAGAIVDGGTLTRAAARHLDARDALDANDSHPLLRATGDLLVTGPTGTNVCDVVLVLVSGLVEQT